MLLRRFGAILYDGLLLAAVLFAATLPVLILTRGAAVGSGDPYYRLYLLITAYIYYGWQWTHGGQTLGMRAWRLKLVDRDGGAVSWRAAGVRFVLAILSWLPLAAGYLWVLYDSEQLAWHDRGSRTRLILLPD